MKTFHLAVVRAFSLFCFALPATAYDLGIAAVRTPYDAYFGRAKTVLRQLDGVSGEAEMRRNLRVARGFRYSFGEPYIPQAPSVTEQTQAGDCKDKSLWLAQKLNDRRVRLVIGKYRSENNFNHAWLLWPQDGRWYVLDPATQFDPIDAGEIGTDRWVPFYSFDSAGRTYLHAAARRQPSREAERPSRVVAVATSRNAFSAFRSWLWRVAAGKATPVSATIKR